MRRYAYITVSVILTLSFMLLGVLCFTRSYLRFYEALVDLWHSLVYYGSELFGFEFTGAVTVTDYSKALLWDVSLPEDWQGFTEKTGSYLDLFFSKENFLGYLGAAIKVVAKGSKILIIAIPAMLVGIATILRFYREGNTNHDVDTKPLRIFKLLRALVYYPIRNTIRSFLRFLRNNPGIPLFWILLWVFHLNIASLLVAFFAYYFYLTMSFEFGSIYVQVCKLVIDLQVFFRTVPMWIIIPLAYVLFDRMRRGIAQNILRHMEARNCGFIKELPIVSLTCGSMGKKKTTVITDMGLSQEVMFRQQAFDLLKQNDMRFPRFPWISFEMQIRRCMEYGTIYNLASIKEWIDLKRQRFMRHRDLERQLYGYRADLYGLVYDDGVIHRDLFDVLESYAKLYFIYVIESSLLVSNYSIRTDHELMDSGNFPMWAQDFFPEVTSERGRHAHILDFDVLRLGRKVIEDNPNNGSFEFGIVMISEVGKERGNVLDHREMRRDNQETNQKNDLFNGWLKMCRHSATVDYFPFIKVFADEQRPESWGADARDLCDILNIADTNDGHLAYPFYTLEEMVYEILTERFLRLYYRFRYNRGDNTLLVYLLKTVVSWMYNRNVRIHNRYGYSVVRIERRRGTMDGKIKRQKYYLMNKKIYARRFSTDCFSDYFNDMALRSAVGLDDYPEYETERASVEELRLQNSYFINSLYRDTGSE